MTTCELKAELNEARMNHFSRSKLLAQKQGEVAMLQTLVIQLDGQVQTLEGLVLKAETKEKIDAEKSAKKGK